MKKLMKRLKEDKIPLNSPISYSSFIDLLKELRLFTVFSTMKIEKCFIEKLQELLNGSGCSTSLVSVPTKSTSCLTAPFQKDVVDAPLLECAEGLQNESLDAVLELSDGVPNEGLISSFISRQIQDTSVTWRSVPTHGCDVVKLEVFPYNQVLY